MFRTLLCTVALTIALTAVHAEAGGFNIKIGGGSSNKGHNGINWNHNNHNHHNNYHYNKYPQVKVYHAPVVKCYYQVCFYHQSWGYKKHEVFTCLHDAEVFAHQLQHNGYYTSISKTCTPYASGHIIYNPGHNTWLP